MVRAFSLAGLLRLRHLEQDAAVGALSAANARLRENQIRRARIRAELAGSEAQPTDRLALTAVAVARSSARGMLAELEALGSIEAEAVARATAALTTARMKTVGLEKLAEKHHVEVVASDLKTEQSAIDELASTAWHRNRESEAT